MNSKSVNPQPVVTKAPMNKVGSGSNTVDTSKSGKNQKTVLLAVAGVVLLSLLITFILRPKSTAPDAVINNGSVQGSEATATNGSPAIQFTVNGQPVESLEFQTQATVTLSTRPLSEINASQISDVTRQGSNWLVTFIDGSQSSLSESRMKQFSDQLEFQVEYRRER